MAALPFSFCFGDYVGGIMAKATPRQLAAPKITTSMCELFHSPLG
jgi:hypothetical protein